MSRRVVGALALALLLRSGMLSAQSIDSLVADSIRFTADVARLERLDSLDQRRLAQSSGVAIQVGPISIVAPEAMAGVAKASAESALRRMHATYGDGMDAFVRSVRFRIRASGVSRPPTLFDAFLNRTLKDEFYLDAYRDGRPAGSQFLWENSMVRVRAAIESQLRDSYARTMDEEFLRFAGSPPRVEPVTMELWRSLARSVAVSAAASRRCAAGALDDCESALGLRPVSDKVVAWYGDSDLPMLFRSLYAGDADWLGRHYSGGTFLQCTEGDIGACRTMVSAIPQEHLAPPMPALARQLYVSVAMEMGGARGLQRLGDARGTTMDVQIAALAGRPMREVTKRFQERIARARSASSGPRPGALLSSMAWIAVALGLGLRGAPWRR